MLTKNLKMEMVRMTLRMESLDVPFIMISNKEFHISTTKLGDNRTTRDLNKGVFYTTFDGVVKPAYGSTERCCIQLQEANKLDKELDDRATKVKIELGDVYAVSLSTNRIFSIKEHRFSKFSKVEKHVVELINSETKEKGKRLLLNPTKESEIPSDAIYYRPSDYAPASIKKGTTYGVSAKNKEDLLNFYKDLCHNIVDESLLGIAIDSGKSVEKKDILKLAPRIGSMTGASINLGKCNVAVIKETFDKESLTDGIGYMDAQKAADSINAFGIIKYGISFGITADDIEGFEIQARPGSSKVKITVTKRKHFKTIAEGKTLLHGDVNTADVLLDKNGVKADINWENITFEYLASCHFDSPAFTSKQLIEKVYYSLVKGNESTEALHEYIAQKMIESFSEKASNVDEREGDLSNDYILEEIAAIKASYPTVRYANRTDLANTFANDIDKLRFRDNELDTTVTLKPDVAAIFGKKLLHKNEICMSDSKYWGKKVIMIKYPAVGGEEYYSATIISPAEVIERATRLLNSNEITEAQHEFLVDYFHTLRPGCAVLPAIKESINTCAGLDFDFDHVSLYFGEKFVKALYKKEQLVDITSEKVREEEMSGRIKIKKISTDLAIEKWTIVANAFRFYSDMGNQSIGAITNASETCLLALIEALQGNMKPCVNILKAWKHRVGKDDVAVKKYEALKEDTNRKVISLPPSKVDSLINSMLAVDLNNSEDVINVFKDLIIVFRSYQERTIDSTKTAEEVKILVKVLVSAKGVQAVELKEGDKIDSVPKIQRKLREKKELAQELNEIGITEIYFDDVFSRLQDELIEKANIAVEELYTDKPTYQSMDSCFVESVNVVFQEMANTGYFDKALDTVKKGMSIYINLMKERSESIVLAEKSYSFEESLAAKKKDIRVAFESKCKEIGIAMSDAYDVCFYKYCEAVGEENIEYVEFHKAVFLFAATMLTKKGDLSWRVTKAQQNLFPEYLKYMLSVAFGKNENIGDRTYIVQELGIKRLAYKDDLKDLANGYGHLRLDRGICVDVREQAQFAFKTNKDITGEVDLKVTDNDEVKAVYRKEILLDKECALGDDRYAVFSIDEQDEEALFNTCTGSTTVTRINKALIHSLTITDFEFEEIEIVNVIVGDAYAKRVPVLVKYKEVERA